jgi:hypothetical protein
MTRLEQIDQELYKIINYLTGIQIRWDPMPRVEIMTRMYKLNRRWYDAVNRYHELTKEEKELEECND